ncbi:MAG: hypothetical protein HZC12_00495 [Nitrospirae bacterium]|nr:hypothetical protein [Nitrospirota bacterium]
MTNINYILKVIDAKATDIQKAIEAAGIKIKSITEVYKEENQKVVATLSEDSHRVEK